MKKIIYIDRKNFINEAISLIKPSNVVLDIGCGIVPHEYVHHDVYIACEPFREYVDVLKQNRKNITRAVYLYSTFLVINENWKSMLDKYENYAVDTIYLIDVIEHLPKEEGKELLKRTEKIARKQIVIFTPLEYIEQKVLSGGEDAWGLHGADYQVHKSVWTPDDFDSDGWSFLLCKDYHQYNNVGEKLNKPVGAFWAIKDVEVSVHKADILENAEIKEMYDIYVRETFYKKIALFNTIEEQKNKILHLNNVVEAKSCELENIKTSRGYKLIVKYRKWRDKMKEIFL